VAAKLTTKQQRFVDAYDGNATQAARIAGYSGSEGTLRAIAAENLTKPNIISAIKSRQNKQMKPHIMSREQRQAFWTEIAIDTEQPTSDRLRASELLGKSEADFVERRIVDTGDRLSQIVAAVLSKQRGSDGKSSPKD
jgi:phage terminase small subunit